MEEIINMKVSSKDPISKRIEVIMQGQVIGYVSEADTDEGYITVFTGKDNTAHNLNDVPPGTTRYQRRVFDTPFVLQDKETKEVYAFYDPFDEKNEHDLGLTSPFGEK